MEKLDYLIEYLLKEQNQNIDNFAIGETEKKKVYRCLVNIRDAQNISSEFLKVEDEYLQEELKTKKIVNAGNIKSVSNSFQNCNIKNSDKICCWKGDITKLEIDCIVNAANSQGLGCFIPNHNCIDNQIHTFAGVRLRLECNEFMKKIDYNLETSNCFITKGYNLPAKNIIHTVGPIVQNILTEELKQDLADTYINCLNCAIENNIRTIAFPCISTGVFRFPKNEAGQIAIKTVDNFISQNRNKLEKVIFSLYSDEDVMIYERNI